MAQHIVPSRTYYLIFCALLFLTYLTVVISAVDLQSLALKYVPRQLYFSNFALLGLLNTAFALGIASLKATLVVLFFMHVKYSTRLTKLAVIGGIYWLGIMFALTLSDYMTRGWRTYG